ncbi:MAG: aminotransferase class V-fold PLP-dependent enzyme, partial [Xanthomonadales bacterium]|nr:aminotransferase class V-fold PLP-dependent enzyme [Xanthomonadales bacterium]
MSATAIRPTTSRSLDPAQIRAQFPILQRQVNGHPLTYLDSANTAQKPQAVIDALVQFYTRHNANVARAVHTLGEEATAAYEAVRGRIA